MADYKITGTDELEKTFSLLTQDAERLARGALYHGAGVMTDAIKESIQNLETMDEAEALKREKGKQIILTGTQKQDLINGFGIAPQRFSAGVYDTHIGFNGYGSRPTKKYPKGLPNQLLARAAESGTSFRRKQPFMRKAIISTREKTIEAMQKSIDEDIKKITGGD